MASLSSTKHVEHQNQRQPSRRDGRWVIEFKRWDIKFDHTSKAKKNGVIVLEKGVELPQYVTKLSWRYYIWKIQCDFDGVCDRRSTRRWRGCACQ
jgi:hypothetical protein